MAWIKKTDEEFQKDKRIRCFSWISILVYWGMCVLVAVTCELYGFQDVVAVPGYGKSISQLIPELPKIAFYSLLIAVVVAWLVGWDYRQTYGKNHPLLCERCGKSKPGEEENEHCPCGGQYISIDHMKWVEK